MRTTEQPLDFKRGVAVGRDTRPPFDPSRTAEELAAGLLVHRSVATPNGEPTERPLIDALEENTTLLRDTNRPEDCLAHGIIDARREQRMMVLCETVALCAEALVVLLRGEGAGTAATISRSVTLEDTG